MAAHKSLFCALSPACACEQTSTSGGHLVLIESRIRAANKALFKIAIECPYPDAEFTNALISSRDAHKPTMFPRVDNLNDSELCVANTKQAKKLKTCPTTTISYRLDNATIATSEWLA